MIEGAERPPPGAPLVVQVCDTTYADAPSQVVAETRGGVREGEDPVLESVEVPFAAAGAGDYTVRVHVDVDGDGAVSPGDFVTTASYPARADAAVRVVVNKV